MPVLLIYASVGLILFSPINLNTIQNKTDSEDEAIYLLVKGVQNCTDKFNYHMYKNLSLPVKQYVFQPEVKLFIYVNAFAQDSMA